MIRTILSVIAGYAAMVILAILGIVIAWNVIGAEGAFAAGTTTASTVWSLTNVFFGFLAAIGGGFVAAAIGKHPTQLPVKALAVLVLAVGLLLAFLAISAEPEPLPEGKTVAELTFTEAGDVARPPGWYNFTIPLLGAVGVLLGGNLKKRS